jgi:DNA-binding HxlR family transcriptional regulator
MIRYDTYTNEVKKMNQNIILENLDKDTWLSMMQISEITGISKNCLIRQLKALRDWNMVEYKRIRAYTALIYVYRAKIDKKIIMA